MSNTGAGTAQHWNGLYARGATTTSWYQAHAAHSLAMLDGCGLSANDSLIDVGGGASILVDELLDRGYDDVTVLDISAISIRAAQQRLGEAAQRVHWLVADLLTWQPGRAYGVWHDRAVFHFLTTHEARVRYISALNAATTTGAVAVFATLAPDGPEQCSGLPVTRYSAGELAGALGAGWRPIADDREGHTTPDGVIQPFTWATFRRL